jgi:hypothetical protein
MSPKPKLSQSKRRKKKRKMSRTMAALASSTRSLILQSRPKRRLVAATGVVVAGAEEVNRITSVKTRTLLGTFQAIKCHLTREEEAAGVNVEAGVVAVGQTTTVETTSRAEGVGGTTIREDTPLAGTTTTGAAMATVRAIITTLEAMATGEVVAVVTLTTIAVATLTTIAVVTLTTIVEATLTTIVVVSLTTIAEAAIIGSAMMATGPKPLAKEVISSFRGMMPINRSSQTKLQNLLLSD